ncbi:capsid maturation protease [Gordonia phage Finkle]|uniref:Capsid maturation protease n=1 Tax=Gordonia phage Finkle TaxID=2926099 RepID=A0A9E7NHI4_9CAUD|nr:capsid maturation protease [Gordonia phage Finkle]UTN92923.1 capsid maturation protease [Gordonia phage Finkle]
MTGQESFIPAAPKSRSLTRLLADPAALAVVSNREIPDNVSVTCRIGDVTNSGGKTSAEVFIYGAIHPWPWEELGEVGANGFVSQLAALDVDEITLRIHSPGGDVYDALAITNALKGHRANVTAVIDGLAASAASFIAQAADTIVIRPNAEMMIHDPSGGVRGNPEQVAEYAKWLDRAGDNIAAIYADRAGGDVADWRAAMKAETWYSADEAVSAGLADETHADAIGTAAEDNRADESEAAAAAFRDARRAYAHSCRAEAPAPTMPAAAGRQEGSDVELRQMIAARLGIAENADDKTIADKLDELTDLATKPDKASEAAAATAYAEKNGLRLVDATKFGEMETELAAARKAEQEATTRLQVAAVDKAVSKGRIAPARRDHFVALMAADPEGTAALLDSLPDETAVPINEVGTAPDADDEKSAYDQLFPAAPGADK